MISTPKIFDNKFTIAVFAGLFAIISSFFSIDFRIGNNQISIMWGLLPALIISMVYGKREAIITSAFGVVISPLIVWSQYNLISIISGIFLSVWLIINSNIVDFKGERVTSLYLKQTIFSLLYLIIIYLATPLINKLTPPTIFGYHIAEIPTYSIISFTITYTLNLFLLVICADTLLKLPIVKEFFDLEVKYAMKSNHKIFVISILSTIFSSILFTIIVKALKFGSFYEIFSGNLPTESYLFISIIIPLSLIICSKIISFSEKQYETEEMLINTKNNLEESSLKQQLLINKLTESENKFKKMIQNSSDVIVLVDVNGNQTFISPSIEKITGYKSSELKKHFTSVIHKDDLPLILEKWQYIVDNPNEDVQVEYRHIHKNGGYVYLEAIAQNFIKDSEIGGYIVNVRDITERKIALEELIQAKDKAEEMNRIKSNFLANISHEFRTPMNGILGFSDIIADSTDDEEIKRMAGYISKSGMRLMETLGLILDLSKIEAEKLELTLFSVDLVAIIQDIFDYLLPDAESRKLDFQFINKVGKAIIISDERMLKQIIFNIAKNALKFTLKGSVQIVLENDYERNERYYKIRVIDSGIGISKEDKELIWQEFRQVSEGFNRTFEGSGLGLTIAKKFIEKLSGKILIESELNKGSIFTVLVPSNIRNIEVSINNDDSLDSEANSIKIPKIKKKILYVEDNIINAQVMYYYLNEDYIIEYVQNGKECLNKISSNKYDVILMDINLGSNMNGIETAIEIRKFKEYQKTPIIAVTGHTLIGDREKMIAEGMNDYISKPFRKEQIINTLERNLYTVS